MNVDEKPGGIDWMAVADWVFCENAAKGIPRMFLAMLLVCGGFGLAITGLLWLFDSAWPLGVLVVVSVAAPALRWVVKD